MDNKKLVPELRFPEFDGSWQDIKLGNSGEFKNGINKGKADFGFGVPFVNLMDVFGKTVLTEQDFGLVNATEKEIKQYELKEGDVLFIRSSVKRSGVGETIVVSKDMNRTVYSGFLIRYRDSGKLSSGFKKYCFWTRKFRNQLVSLSTSSANTNINQESLNKLSLIVPNIKEQQKIASFLTAIDKSITLLKQKKAALEQYKKGLMQKIFSQELRFKQDDGNDYPDWEEKRFSDLYEFKRTNSFSRDKLNYVSGEIKNIHYGDIHTKFRSHFNVDDEEVPYVNDDVDLSKIKEDEFIQAGDLIIADASEDYDDIGKAIEATNIENQKIIAGLHTFLARRINDQLSVGFAGLMMQSENVRLQIKKIAQGTKVLGISMGRLSKIKLELPSPEEQQKIADCLSAIDQSINQLSKQIDQTTQFKKGLLQRMFV